MRVACSDQNARGYLVPYPLTKHCEACDCNGQVEKILSTNQQSLIISSALPTVNMYVQLIALVYFRGWRISRYMLGNTL